MVNCVTLSRYLLVLFSFFTVLSKEFVEESLALNDQKYTYADLQKVGNNMYGQGNYLGSLLVWHTMLMRMPLLGRSEIANIIKASYDGLGIASNMDEYNRVFWHLIFKLILLLVLIVMVMYYRSRLFISCVLALFVSYFAIRIFYPQQAAYAIVTQKNGLPLYSGPSVLYGQVGKIEYAQLCVVFERCSDWSKVVLFANPNCSGWVATFDLLTIQQVIASSEHSSKDYS